MHKIAFILGLVISLTGNLFAADSLTVAKKIAELTTAVDTQKLRLYDEISWLSRRLDDKQATEHANLGLKLAETLGDSVMVYKFHFNLGLIKAETGAFREGISLMEIALNYFQKNQQKKLTAEAFSHLGHIYSKKGDFQYADSLLNLSVKGYGILNEQIGLRNSLEIQGINFIYQQKYAEAKEALIQALDICESKEKPECPPSIYMNLGICEKNLGNYTEAVEIYLKALNRVKDESVKALLLGNLGGVYHKIGQFDKALDYHEKSFKLKEKLNNQRSMVYSLVNIGAIHSAKKNYGEALNYYTNALNIIQNLEGENNQKGSVLLNIGNVHNNLGDYPQAESYYKLALNEYNRRGNRRGQSLAFYNIAHFYSNQKKRHQAIQFAKKSLEIAKKNRNKDRLVKIYELMAENYEALKDFDEALNYGKLFWTMKDSLYNEAKAMEIAALENDFQQKQQEKESALQTEKIKVLEKEKALSRLKLFLWILSSVTLLLIAGFTIFRQKERIKNARQNQSVLEKQLSEHQNQLDNYLKKLMARTELLEEIQNKTSNGNPDDLKLSSGLSDLLNENLDSEKDWQDFKYYFSMVHRDFFKKLKTEFPNITSNELNLCAFVKLNLVNKEIAKITGISPDSVRKAKHRLSKKLNLSGNEALRDFIIKI